MLPRVTIRVVRHGSGPTAVTTADEVVGDKPAIVEWIRRHDGDVGDDFAFAQEPLEKLPCDLFKIVKVEPHKVTVEYAGCQNKSEWDYYIHVKDVTAEGEKTGVTSDGSAKIKNH